MTAKEYLSQIRDLEAQIQGYLYDIERMEALATKTTATIQSDRVQSSPDQQKMETAIIRMHTHKEKLAQTIETFVRDRAKIIRQIDGMGNGPHKTLLRKRYIDGDTFEKISVDMNYSYRHTTRMHGAALAAFAEMYGGSWNKS